MLNVILNRSIAASTDGKLVELGYTHQELTTFTSELKSGEYGWITTDSGNGYNLHNHFKVIADGQPRFTNSHMSEGDISFFRKVMGPVADIYLTNHI